MLKKPIVLFICFALLLSSMVFTARTETSAESIKQNVNLTAFYLENKPSKAGDINLKDFQSTHVLLTNVDIDTNGVNALEGSVTIGTEEIPFSLQGQFYKTGAVGRVSASLVDSLNNFDVKRFEIQQDVNKGIFLNDNLQNNSFALYLVKKNTNSLLVIEGSALDLINDALLGQLYSNIPNLEQAPDYVAMWLPKMFEPDQTTVKDNNLITPMSTYSKFTSHSYSDTYMFHTYTVTDTITIKETATFPTTTSEDVVARIEVTNISYAETYTGGSQTLNYYTGWRIGDGPTGGVLGLKLNTSSPQIIVSQLLDGVMYKNGGLTMDIGYSLSYLGASADFTLTTGGSEDINKTAKILPANTTTSYAKKGSRDTSLANIGDYFAAKWDIATNSNAGSNNANATVTFQFSVYNVDSGKNLGYYTEYSTSTSAITSL